MNSRVDQKNYLPPSRQHWKGRATKAALGLQYWYQAIELVDIYKNFEGLTSEMKPAIALLGYACDEGVRRNLGRIGAKNGPIALRRKLAAIAFHHGTKRIADFGDLVCDDSDLEACQDQLAVIVEQLLQNAIFPIIIGGGHDISYGHFKGIWNAISKTSNPTIGIINFDAHFDLRPLEHKANSGTPFYQILEEHPENARYLALGIQQQSNTKELFDIAKSKGVNFIENYDCIPSNLEGVLNQLKPFVESNDYLYLTIDMDGFSSAFAPGVSAPSPLGFRPFFVLKLLEFLLESGKVLSCDIAELNPEFDRDNATANLVARIVDFIVANR